MSKSYLDRFLDFAGERTTALDKTMISFGAIVTFSAVAAAAITAALMYPWLQIIVLGVPVWRLWLWVWRLHKHEQKVAADRELRTTGECDEPAMWRRMS